MFYAANGDKQQEQFDEILQICDEIAPNWPFREGGNNPHFRRVFLSDVGFRIELTEPDELGARNRGGLCFSMPGTCWWIQDSATSALTLWRLSKIDGFKHFTRLDFQNTELDPEWPAQRMAQAVDDGLIWVKGSTRYRDWAEKDADGELTNGLTLYWNSARSEKLSKSYDKAADASWETAAVRDETQTRGRWAHAHGRELIRDLDSARNSAEMVEVVDRHTCSALLQHLDYWTLNGTSPKTDKNWKRKAEPADWYRARIGKRCEPIQKAPKALADLETTVDYGVQQYGRHMYRWIVTLAKKHDLPENFVMEALCNRFKTRLREEDMDWYLEGLTERQKGTALKQLDKLRDEVSRAQEQGWWSQ